MKSKKFVLVLIAFLSVYILLAGYFSFLKHKDIKVKENIDSVVSIDKNIEVPVVSDDKDIANKINFILKVSEKIYTGAIKEGGSVYNAMQMLTGDSKQSFSFKVKEYPSMGFFVEEINGEKGDTGKFWIYYINNEKASVGVSKYILKSGDIIEWKQEASF